MKNSAGRRIATALTMVGLLTTAGMAQEGPFPLTSAIPDDVFVVTAERHNPERSFLDGYWGDVFQAFNQSGVCDEITGLMLGAAPEHEQAELTRVTERFGELFATVDWKGLVGGEVVFAERLRAPIFFEPGGIVAQPDMVMLFRVDRDVAAKAFTDLRAILVAATEEARSLAELPLEVEELTLHDTQLVSIDVLQLFEGVPSMPISVGLRDDVVLATYGLGIREQVTALLAGQGEQRSIAANPRFKRALESLPPDAEALEFVEFHNLRAGLDRFMGAIFARVEAELEVEEHMLNAVREGEVYALTRRALVPYRAGRYDEALELTLEAHRMDPTDTLALFNLACLYSLKGEPETALDWLEKAVAGGFHAPTAIASDADLTALRTEPRYAELLGRAMLAARDDSFGPVVAARALIERALQPLVMLDYAVTGRRTKGYATHEESITVLAPDAARSAFRPVLANRAGMKDFMRYLPQATTSFEVSAGIDLLALYEFIETSIAQAGAPGQQALTAWSKLQERFDFDVREDVLGWIEGATVQASFQIEDEDVWVWRLRVRDDTIAREKLELVLNELPQMLSELATEHPMLGMLAMRTNPTAHEELQDFHDVAVGMMVNPLVCGVREGWLIMGASADAVAFAEKTAAGEYPTAAANEELMRRALLPDGSMRSVSFTDHRGDAETAAAILTGISTVGRMAAASIPDAEARAVLGQVFGIVAKLPPVVSKIDFYESSAHATTFDGKAWYTRSVTYYVSPERRGSPEPVQH